MTQSVNLSNYKLSAKLKPITQKNLECLCLSKGIYYKKYSNFICFNLLTKRKYFAYTIWKKAECLKKDQSQNNTVHWNITKVEKGEIRKSIRYLQKFLNIPVEKISYQIDNITASIKVNHKINLKKFIHENPNLQGNITYNPEKFPGLRVKRKKLTYILFTSGSIVIVGGKSKAQILNGIPWVMSNIPKLKKYRQYG